MKKFRNEVMACACVMAAAAEAVSLVVAGPGVFFPLGLAIGTAASAAGFVILIRTGQMLMDERKKSPVVLGYFLRIVIYGIAFLLCIKLDLRCGFGCGCGLVTIHFGILFLYGIVYRFVRKKKNPLNDWTEPKEWKDLSIYDEEDDDW